MTLFQNKYRIESARMKNWDYRNAGAYFITICTKDRLCHFGKIQNGEMQLSDAGKITQSEWLKTPELRPDMNLELGEFVVMPNHFHAIIIIGQNEFNIATVEMPCMASLPLQYPNENTSQPTGNQFGPQRKNLASIVRGFKSAVTTQARQDNPDFAWQPRFHDHIIRDYQEYNRIENYIINNPKNWDSDKSNFLSF